MTAEKPLAVVVVDDTYETLEFHYPRLRLIEAGYEVKTVAPQKDTVYKCKMGYWAKSTHTVSEVNPKDVKVLIIPGGMCTDRLRRYEEFKTFVSDCWAGGKGSVVSFICHGGWLPVSAKILQGRKVTCFFAIADDLSNAGAEVDLKSKCVVDGRMITAQTPEDLPAFMKETIRVANEAFKLSCQ